MNPEELFCLNFDCPAKGHVGKGNIHIHSQQEGRCVCSECGDTFSATKGTLFYRLRTPATTVVLVLTLLAYGCPMQAICAAFGFDERTVKNWWDRAGEHCESFHKHMLSQQQLDLGHVQADEIKAKTQGGYHWIAMAISVPTRLWLGGVAGASRSRQLIDDLFSQIRSIALCRPMVIAVDGFSAYVGCIRRAFRSPLPRYGQPGRPKLVSWPDIAIVQVVKQRSQGSFNVTRRIVQGCQSIIDRIREATQGIPGVINTSYIERINATFRQRLHWLTRRSRSLAQKPQTLLSGIYIVGSLYNFCDLHHSLKVKIWIDERQYRWVYTTTAMAAGITDHQWSVHELLAFRIPPSKWMPPKSIGRPSKQTLEIIQQWAS